MCKSKLRPDRGLARSSAGVRLKKRDMTEQDLSSEPIGWDRDDVSYYAKQRKKRSRKKALIITLVVCVCVIGALAAAAIVWAMGIQASLNEGVDENIRNVLTDTESVDDPFYMLLLGVDKNKDRAESSEYGEEDSAYRSDTIILARIDPPQKQVTLVSLHRDLLVDMDEYGVNKLNNAYSFGGPSYVIEVVSELAGVPISHYAEVNFDEFDELVDSLGGIEVDVPIDINDPYAGEPISAGPQTLDGAQALTLCRSRHAYDDYGDGDVFRAANQRMVIAAIAKKIMAVDPLTLASTISQLAEMVTTDMSVGDLLHLADEMRGIDLDNNVYSGMTPTTSLYQNGGWYELLDTEAWQTMMARVDSGLSPYASADEDLTAGLAGSQTENIKNGEVSEDSLTFQTDTPEDVDATVLVLNGTGIGGLASRVAASLERLGYETSTGNAANDYDYSVVAYSSPENRAAAEAVASALGGSIDIEDWQGVYETDSDVIVVLGLDMANSVDPL